MAEQLIAKPGFQEIYTKSGAHEQLHDPEQVRQKVLEHVKSVTSHAAAAAQSSAQTPAQQSNAQAGATRTAVALEKYVQLAFQEGLTAATEKILQTGNPFLIDEFHDVLVESFMNELRASGKMK